MSEILQVLSYGGGVNTAAILALTYKGELKIDYILFADTGCEYPDTYKWTELIAKPVCKTLRIPFITVRGNASGTNNLYDYCWNGNIIPMRQQRWCTDKFKKIPLNKWREKNLYGMPHEVLIGFSADESYRAKGHMEVRYPLIELGYTRKDCKKIIKSIGWPVPPKSGCYICPFSRIGQWKKLYEVHPELFKKAEMLEKRLRKYPEVRISSKPLEDIRKKLTDTKQADLGLWEKDGFEKECGMCHV